MEEIYPENIDEIIVNILEENNLWEIHQKEIFRMIQEKEPEKRKEIFQNLPGVKLAKIVRGLFLKEIRPENLDFHIKEAFNLPEEGAKKIAQKLIDLVSTSEEIFKSSSQEEKPSRDIYRESLE